MIRYFMLWWRAKTYCPVIESLRTEPEAWVTASKYTDALQKKDRYAYMYADYASLFHKELHIEITKYDYSHRDKEVKRNGHILPVHQGRLKQALAHRKNYFEEKRKAAALAELNRVTQDAQTLRLARIVQLRKELAQQEAADFAYRLEHDNG